MPPGASSALGSREPLPSADLPARAPSTAPAPRAAFIIIDVQHDFIAPGGALAIPRGEEVVPVINKIRRSCRDHLAVVAFTQDFHPPGHVSFTSSHAPPPPLPLPPPPAPALAGAADAAPPPEAPPGDAKPPPPRRQYVRLVYDKRSGELLECSRCGRRCRAAAAGSAWDVQRQLALPESEPEAAAATTDPPLTVPTQLAEASAAAAAADEPILSEHLDDDVAATATATGGAGLDPFASASAATEAVAEAVARSEAAAVAAEVDAAEAVEEGGASPEPRGSSSSESSETREAKAAELLSHSTSRQKRELLAHKALLGPALRRRMHAAGWNSAAGGGQAAAARDLASRSEPDLVLAAGGLAGGWGAGEAGEVGLPTGPMEAGDVAGGEGVREQGPGPGQELGAPPSSARSGGLRSSPSPSPSGHPSPADQAIHALASALSNSDGGGSGGGSRDGGQHPDPTPPHGIFPHLPPLSLPSPGSGGGGAQPGPATDAAAATPPSGSPPATSLGSSSSARVRWEGSGEPGGVPAAALTATAGAVLSPPPPPPATESDVGEAVGGFWTGSGAAEEAQGTTGVGSGGGLGSESGEDGSTAPASAAGADSESADPDEPAGGCCSPGDAESGSAGSGGSGRSGSGSGSGTEVVLQRLWPEHCVAGRQGADLALGLLAGLPSDLVIRKGAQGAVDGYSAFADNLGLHPSRLQSALQAGGVTRLLVAGVATEYCVLWTVRDAVRLGYEVWVVVDGVRGLGGAEEAAAVEEMAGLPGVELVSSEAVISAAATWQPAAA
ncbi:hypothetical protein HYH03_016670 [Edaphochlamys debaryana]|uniref:nicotinamidase n=1 Tax=Edaphochlamys debaryana TaxID=47281 RepID=A0A835XR15_9CHLO|nr:hypothetical protein HYH03_016670 [Edaphochlamys debaryana]|eukprot:KAG2484534.1 hypothetical protein HYH03_016670 [Edaphochlamys debaryana]